MSDYFICPNCDAEVPRKATACPECGSDKNTGWSEDTLYDGLDLPESEEPIQERATPLFYRKYFIGIVSVLTLLAFLLIYFL
ncbi:MAG: hypothetical protein MRJ65_15100 [Candidatus Brocadiaceae bacterium]|nr:hypothetical protein [Candidatus Brocadiaceae bacterium]